MLTMECSGNFNGLSARMTHEFVKHTMLEGKMLTCRRVFMRRIKRERREVQNLFSAIKAN